MRTKFYHLTKKEKKKLLYEKRRDVGRKQLRDHLDPKAHHAEIRSLPEDLIATSI